MADMNCSACDELRESATDFAVNGVTKKVCTSLKNNTGLNPSNSNTNCDDLNDANDCLVGKMAGDLEAYEVCDWKDYMKKFVTNLYNILKAMLCWMCGMQESLDRAWCWLRHITIEQKTYSIHAYEDDDPSKPAINGFRIAEGVEMRQPAPGSGPIRVISRGSVVNVSGSLNFYGNMPLDYTNGEEVSWNELQYGFGGLTNKGGLFWGRNGNAGTSEPLVYEIQFKKCQLGFSRFFSRGLLFPSLNGEYLFTVHLYQKGDMVPPDYSNYSYGADPNVDKDYYMFNPDDDDMLLMQVRLNYTILPLLATSPSGTFDVIACPESLDC